MTQTTKNQNANRVMIRAEASRLGMNVAFADGVSAFVPWERVREVGGLSEVAGVSLNGPYEARVSTKRGETSEIPWDFARAFGDDGFRIRMDEAESRARRKFAACLRDRRRAAGMSKRDLAERGGLDEATVARLETAAQQPKLDAIRKLAAALNCPVHALLMDEDDEDLDAV